MYTALEDVNTENEGWPRRTDVHMLTALKRDKGIITYFHMEERQWW